eukprot:CAMPEP_0184754178 /NCGR_PEP_ID=MMETSP0315-20130426/44481_1 /TAXON_ID=101924 /ORGANISM="Rhodosorus marinus, Strain UTEX LB 2760" /LENGTH=647 /DNA_ID=CAMNT_0027233581 /DNA_START=105 /DNA_END=2048 /DNA_ORIENTATION=-
MAVAKLLNEEPAPSDSGAMGRDDENSSMREVAVVAGDDDRDTLNGDVENMLRGEVGMKLVKSSEDVEMKETGGTEVEEKVPEKMAVEGSLEAKVEVNEEKLLENVKNNEVLEDAKESSLEEAKEKADMEARLEAERRAQREERLEKKRLQREKEERDKVERAAALRESRERERQGREANERKRQELVKVVAERSVEILARDAEHRKRTEKAKARMLLDKGAEEAPRFVEDFQKSRACRRKRRRGREVDLNLAASGVELLQRESKVFRSIIELERDLDLKIIRKHVEVSESLMRNVQTKTCIFRLQIRSQILQERRQPTKFKLQVFGNVISDTSGFLVDAGKFSNLFKKAVVEIRRPKIQQNNAIEWVRGAKGSRAADGFEILRAGDGDFTAVLRLYPESNPDLFQVREPLASLIGIKIDTKSGIVMGLWRYIKEKALLGFEDKSAVKVDDGLRKIIPRSALEHTGEGVVVFKLSSVFDLVNRYLVPFEPFTVPHVVHNASSLAKQNYDSYDLRIELPDPLPLVEAEKAGVLTAIFPSNPDDTVSLPAENYLDLAHQHLAAIESLVRHKRRRDCFEIASRNPAHFANMLSLSQARDLRVARGATGLNPEEERRSQYYYQQWVHDVIPGYIFRKMVLDTEATYNAAPRT